MKARRNLDTVFRALGTGLHTAGDSVIAGMASGGGRGRQDHSGPLGTTWDHLGPPGTTWVQPGPSGPFESTRGAELVGAPLFAVTDMRSEYAYRVVFFTTGQEPG